MGPLLPGAAVVTRKELPSAEMRQGRAPSARRSRCLRRIGSAEIQHGERRASVGRIGPKASFSPIRRESKRAMIGQSVTLEVEGESSQREASVFDGVAQERDATLERDDESTGGIRSEQLVQVGSLSVPSASVSDTRGHPHFRAHRAADPAAFLRTSPPPAGNRPRSFRWDSPLRARSPRLTEFLLRSHRWRGRCPSPGAPTVGRLSTGAGAAGSDARGLFDGGRRGHRTHWGRRGRRALLTVAGHLGRRAHAVRSDQTRRERAVRKLCPFYEGIGQSSTRLASRARVRLEKVGGGDGAR